MTQQASCYLVTGYEGLTFVIHASENDSPICEVFETLKLALLWATINNLEVRGSRKGQEWTTAPAPIAVPSAPCGRGFRFQEENSMKLYTVAIIITALCYPAAADWRDDAKDAVTSSATDTQHESFPTWMLVVIIEHQQHIDIHGYADDDACVKAGMTMMTKAEALPWFCVIEPRRDVVE